MTDNTTNVLIDWLLTLITEFAKFGSWLTEPLPYINQTPLAMFGYTGILILVSILLVRLFVGG